MVDLVSLDLFYLDFRVPLAMALLSLVLFPPFLLEDYDLLTSAVADYGSFDGSVATDLRVLAGSNYESRNVDLRAFFTLETRDTKRLTVFNRELLAARLNYCVTHLYLPRRDRTESCPLAEKLKLYGKHWPGSN